MPDESTLSRFAPPVATPDGSTAHPPLLWTVMFRAPAVYAVLTRTAAGGRGAAALPPGAGAAPALAAAAWPEAAPTDAAWFDGGEALSSPRPVAVGRVEGSLYALPVGARPGGGGGGRGRPARRRFGEMEGVATGEGSSVVVVESGRESEHADAFMCPAGVFLLCTLRSFARLLVSCPSR